MQCRLYPNKEAAQHIDEILHSVKAIHNSALYDTFTNNANTNERPDKKTENIVHYPDVKKMAKAAYLNELKERMPHLHPVPAGALQGQNGIFLADVKRMLESQVGKDSDKETVTDDSSKSKPQKKTYKVKEKKKSDKTVSGEKKGKVKPVENSEPHYYSKKHPRRSYTYQQTLSKITLGDNPNTMYINLTYVGDVKLRGWNQKIRFGENHEDDFREYIKKNPSKQITITIKKDKCGDYWISFKLMNIWKPFATNTSSSVGIDVGIKDIAILSDGTKYENKRFRENESERLKALNRRLSRREGHSNYKFREKQKSDHDIVPSKRYLATQKTIQELEREIHRKRNDYYHNISRDIIEQNNFIGVESLNISGMMKNHHIAKAASDASMHTLLQMLKYKSDWHHRTIQPIDQWKPSSKRCSVCGYLYPDMTLAVREWTCPECGTHHDRDINAAKNILHFAMETLE